MTTNSVVCLSLLWLVAVAVTGVTRAAPPAGGPDNNGDEAALNGTGGLRVFVGRKGGVIRVFRDLPHPPPPPMNGSMDAGKEKQDMRPRPKTGEISIFFGKMQELDASFNAISGQHDIKQFGNIDYVVTTINNENMQQSSDPADLPVYADCLQCATTLTGVGAASMQLQVCVIKTNGTIVLGDERLQVMSGQMKFNVRLAGWPWSAGGQFIDADIIIKVPPGRAVGRQQTSDGNAPPPRDRRPAGFGLGGDAMAYFSKKVNIDGVWKNMTDGFPLLDTKGANNIVTLRIPRFSISAFYDPTVDAGSQAYSSATALHAAAWLWSLTLSCCILAWTVSY